MKKKPRKRSKAVTDAIKAFQLVCILVVATICISLVIIIVHNNRSSQTEETTIVTEPEETKTDTSPVAVTVKEDPIQTFSPHPPHPPHLQINTGAPEPIVTSTPTPANTITTTPTPANTNTTTPTPANTITTTSTPTTTPANTVTTINTTANTNRTVADKGILVFVIDDAGNNLTELDPFLRIPGPLTIAVLPGLPHSAEAARRIREAGKEVILHQPMEAIGGFDPGPGAIYSGMNAGQIREILSNNIAEVGPVAGMNNHQGSKITMDREMMEVILSFCVENNLYFLDSRTTAETAAPAAARRLGIKIAQRDTFLDNEQSRESIMRYLNNGLTRAQRNGSSVMIGHTWSPALAPLLAEQFPMLIIQGYTLKTAGDLLR